ncbi:hypothetical protein ACLOJK_015555 [Asimina triloba]
MRRPAKDLRQKSENHTVGIAQFRHRQSGVFDPLSPQLKILVQGLRSKPHLMNYYCRSFSAVFRSPYSHPSIIITKEIIFSVHNGRLSNTHFSNSLSSSFRSISGIARNPFDRCPQRSAHCEHSADVVDEISERSIISWTAKISRFCRSGREDEAVGCFKSMLLHGGRPNYITLLSVIRAIAGIRVENLTYGIHGFLIKLGFEAELSVVTALLGIYSFHGILNAEKVFALAPEKDLISWSAMVAAYSKNGHFLKAIETFRKMQHFGIEPNNVSIVSVLNASADLGSLKAGKQIHGFLIVKEFSSDTNVQNSLMDMYNKCGEVGTSILVFYLIGSVDLVSWNTIISGCAENRHPRKALAMFSSMQSSGVAPDDTTVRSALSACSQIGELAIGLAMHTLILKDGLLKFVPVGTALLKMYADFGEVLTSKALFDGLCHRDVVARSAMVSVFARAGHPHCAVEMFKQMQVAEEKPNQVTLVGLLQACSSMGNQDHGKSIHAYALKFGSSHNVFLTSALIDFYCKFGRLREGKALFDQIPNKDLVCWGSMINGYAMNGCGTMALNAFGEMLQYGVQPNDIVFISLLSACSHCGLLDEGWRLFHCMEFDYGIRPSLVHHACIVDLLSRCGRVEEAFEFIKGMPLEPDASIWGALIGGCQSQRGNIEIAEVAANELLRLDPDNTSYCVILSNLYAEHGRWGDVERLRKLLRKKRMRKTIGYSAVKGS